VASGLKLYLFECGRVALMGVEVPVPFYLLRHPEGDVLVDGGNPLAIASDARAHLGELADLFEVHMSAEQHCVAQLERLGVGPDAVRYLVQTHLHFDHTGALGHFPDAQVVVHADELRAARQAESTLQTGYVRADFDRPELRWRQVDGPVDLFEDGAVRVIETPGHSAGHMSLLLHLDETGPVLLTADATDNLDQFEVRQHPRALFSREDANQSVEKLRALAQELGPLIVFGHDPDNWAGLRHAPEHYA
jgi:glyoxylase-like metal-dependent hydrolase (beta-lactamase superfamily II)